jgi:hypothetical protein
MPTFKDCNNREWHLWLDAPTINQVRKQCNIDLADLTGASVEKLATDPCLLVDVLWVLCRDQATAANISDAQFGKALIGDPIDQAADKLVEAILDFFPKRRRELLSAVATKFNHLRTLGIDQAIEKLNDPALDQAIKARLQTDLDKALSGLTQSSSATNTPDS